MTNPFYTATGAPVQESRGTSPAVRNEFSLLQTAMDGVFAAIDIGAASGTSTTSLLVGAGSKSFTIQAGRAFSPGQSVVLAYNVTPTTQMTGTITSYNRTTGAVVMNVTGSNGSGTYADWTLSLSPSGGATLGANVFTGVQDWATGANIASASTVNLDTATGNRVHITGTTTITGWTLTRGPRTVIFDNSLQLTYNATSNRLNSNGANVTVEAGDMAHIESDGTAVYVNVTRKNGAAIGGGSGLVLLATASASSVAAVDFTTLIDSAYDEYELHLQNVLPATNNVNFQLRTSTNNGSSFDSAAGNYLSAAGGYRAAIADSFGSVSATQILLIGGCSNAAANGGVSGVVRLIAPAGVVAGKQVLFELAGYDANYSQAKTWSGMGLRNSTSAVNAVRFLFDSGNVASGFFKLYGVRKTV